MTTPRYQHFFVVAGVLENGEWTFGTDPGTCSDRFTDGCVWDVVEEKWLEPKDDLLKQDIKATNLLDEIINEANHRAFTARLEKKKKK
jgi:hypothetical protein